MVRGVLMSRLLLPYYQGYYVGTYLYTRQGSIAAIQVDTGLGFILESIHTKKLAFLVHKVLYIHMIRSVPTPEMQGVTESSMSPF